ILPPNQTLLNIISIGIIFFSFVSLPRTLTLIRENLFALILDSTAGADLYGQSNMALLSKSSSQFNIIAILGGVCGNIALVFFMYYLTIENKKKYILWGLGISSLLGPIANVANGSRFMLGVFIFNSGFLFIFIRRFIKPEFRKKLTRGILISGITLLIPFVALTLSRNKGEADRAFEMVEDYLSQGFLNFNKYGLDAGGIREGDYTIVVFKYVAQLQPAMYYSGRISKYWTMKLNESNFYTFVGDFTLDYGPISALLIFVMFALFLRKIIRPKKGVITFQQYLIVYVLIVTCIGYFQFTLGREEGNLNLIALLSLALIFKLSDDIRKHKRNLK
ncbi:MAG: oligosaccharide repeat unit polymerase, partial [Ruminococcus sp.]|nr:oligosaccharide repeat unit polymerase [Ruminococcus sp.]